MHTVLGGGETGAEERVRRLCVDVAAEIIDGERIRTAISKAKAIATQAGSRPAGADRGGTDPFPGKAPVGSLEAMVGVRVARSPDHPDQRLIHIHMDHLPRAYATIALEELARSFVQDHHRPHALEEIDQQRAQLDAAIEFWQGRAESAEAERTTFIAEELQRRKMVFEQAASRQAEAMRSGASVSVGSGNAESPLPVVDMLNPDWQVIAEELQGANSRLADLLRRLTPEHPGVQSAKMAVRHLEERLAGTPQTIPLSTSSSNEGLASGSELGGSAGSSDTSGGAPTLVTLNEAQAREELENLASVQEMKRGIEEAQGKLQRLTAEREALPSVDAIVYETVTTQSPARVVASMPRRVSRERLAAILCVAIVVGGLLARVAPRPESLECFMDERDVVEVLRLPVRGPIPTTDGPPMPRGWKRRIPDLVYRGVIVSEWAILATAGLLLLSISTDAGQSRALAADPLRALATAAHRLTGTP